MSAAVAPGVSTRIRRVHTGAYAATGECTPLATITSNASGCRPQLVITPRLTGTTRRDVRLIVRPVSATTTAVFPYVERRPSAMADLGLPKTTAVDAPYRNRQFQRRAVHFIRLAAHPERHTAARPRLGSLRHGFPVVQTYESPRTPAPVQFVRQHRAVRSRPAARIVTHIQQAHRAVGRQRHIHRLRDADKLTPEVAPKGVEMVREFSGNGLREFRITIRHGDHRGAHFRHIGVGESKHNAVRQHTRPVQEFIRQFIHRPAGSGGRQLPFDIDGNRRKRGGLGGTDLASKRPRHQPRRLDAHLLLVKMGIAAIGDGRVAGRNHPLRQIRVRIDRADDGRLVSNRAPQPGQPVSVQVPIVLALTHVRPVGRHKPAIQSPGAFDLIKHQLNQRVACLLRNPAGRFGAGVKQRHRFDTRLLQPGEESTDFVQSILVRDCHLFSSEDAAGPEILQCGGSTDECIRLVHQ